MRSDAIDLTGRRLGSITILSYAGIRVKDTLWDRVCDCGKTFKITGRRARCGVGQSCGCQPGPKALGWSGQSPANKSHGESIYSKNHSAEYSVWAGIKSRTSNPKVKCSKNYLDRGISICDEWKSSYRKFLAYVGRRPSAQHSLGRIDNDKGYEPGNVRWETAVEQANNKRTSRIITVNGIAQTVAQWARQLGIKDTSIYWLPDDRASARIRSFL